MVNLNKQPHEEKTIEDVYDKLEEICDIISEHQQILIRIRTILDRIIRSYPNTMPFIQTPFQSLYDSVHFNGISKNVQDTILEQQIDQRCYESQMANVAELMTHCCQNFVEENDGKTT